MGGKPVHSARTIAAEGIEVGDCSGEIYVDLHLTTGHIAHGHISAKTARNVARMLNELADEFPDGDHAPTHQAPAGRQ